MVQVIPINIGNFFRFTLF